MTMATFKRGKPIMVDYTPASALAAGDVVVVGGVPFVAHVDNPPFGTATIKDAIAALGGVYTIPADAAYGNGTFVYWDTSAQKVTTVQSSTTVPFGFIVGGPTGDLVDAGPTGSGSLCDVLHHPMGGIAPVQPYSVSISRAAGSTNISLVTFQVKDQAGTNLTAPANLVITLSDAASGAGLTATTASGAVAAGTAGADLSTLVSKKALLVQTDATGKYILSITDSAKTGFYPTGTIPGRAITVGAQLVTGSYG